MGLSDAEHGPETTLAASEVRFLILCRAGLNSASALMACSRAMRVSSAEILFKLCASSPHVAFGEEESMLPTALTPLFTRAPALIASRLETNRSPQARPARLGVIRGRLQVTGALSAGCREQWLTSSWHRTAHAPGSAAVQWSPDSTSQSAPVLSPKTCTGRTPSAKHQCWKFEEIINAGDGKPKPLPTTLHSRCAASLAVLDGELYTCGGLTFDEGGSDATEVFDPDTETWHVIPPPLPGVQCRVWEVNGILASQLCFAGSFRENIPPYLGLEGRNVKYSRLRFGMSAWSSAREAGLCSMNSAERFDFRSGQWEMLPPMLRARSFAAAGVVGGHLYVCGGQDEDWNVLSSVERFDPITMQWEELPPLRIARCEAAAGSLRGRPCVCAGLDCDGELVPSVEVFLEELGKWETLEEGKQLPCLQSLQGQHCIGPVAVTW
mmetsp:Transcript_78942/g.143867  ORF Transcript_78942/g.143867 Transcript_78942/m.143867 type:complete len:438 (-) Transcript_78942:89-1402(-)